MAGWNRKLSAEQPVTQGQERQFLTLLCVLAGLLLFYGRDRWYDLAVVLFFVLVAFWVRSYEMCGSLYFLLVYFEPILDLPFVGGGSLFVLFEIILAVRYVHRFGWRLQLRRDDWLIYLVGAVRLISVFTCGDGLKVVASVIINFAVLLLVLSGAREKRYFLAAIAIAAVASGAYGVLRGTSMDYGSYLRFYGVIADPNYSAYEYTVGIFAALGCRLFGKWGRAAVVGILLVWIALTVSMSGIVFLAVLLALYVLLRRAPLGLLAFGIVGIAAVAFLLLPVQSGPLYPIHTRLTALLENAALGDWVAVTTNRSNLAKNYLAWFFANSSALQILFGGQNILSGPARAVMVAALTRVSHNAYVDILYFCGLLGGGAIVGGIAARVLSRFARYFRETDTEALSLAMIGCTVLLYMAVLSLFPYRYWYGLVLL